ncbi:MAG: MBL fold metallo-hydrolase [Pseudomonadota bacterium]
MLRWLTAITGLHLTLAAGVAAAGCFPVAERDASPRLADTTVGSVPADATVTISFLGHASFLLESREGITAITDYNGMWRAAEPPRIVTMNNSHSTHFTDVVEPEIEFVLRGWNPEGGLAEHDVVVDDMRVRNVPTSVRGRADWNANSNSIFVFEIDDLCVAHLGHLHHPLTDQHLGELGLIDILLVPVDGMWTMPQPVAIQVIEQVRPSVVIPMHYFGESVLASFLALLPDDWSVQRAAGSTVGFTRQTLPFREVLVLQGY